MTSDMGQVGGSVSWVVVIAFAVAAALKFRALHSFRDQLRDYQVLPEPVLPVAALAVPAVEAGAVTLAVLPATRPIGFGVLVVLLVVFTVVVSLSIRAGRTSIRCACFGQSSTTLDVRVVARNLMLAACAVTGLVADSAASSAGVAVAALLSVLAWLGLEATKLFGFSARFGRTA